MRHQTPVGVALFVLLLGAAVQPFAPPVGTTAQGSAAALAVPGRANGTPWVASAGRTVAVAWGASLPDAKTDVFVAVSRDAGATFGAPVQVNTQAGEARLHGEMPPRVSVIDRGAGAAPEIVVLWTARAVPQTFIKLARSRDGGRTFDAPVMLQTTGAVGDRGWPSVALDDRGAAHAIWLDHRGLVANKTAATDHSTHDGVAMAQKSGLYYAAASPKPQLEREVTTGVCYCCKTAMAIGPGGTIYSAWRHVYAGNLRDIAFTTSRDRGKTFAPPIRVSEDGWEVHGCPDDGPAMAIDAAGTVHVVWPTVVGGAEPRGALFYASTKDGRTFTPRTRVPTLGGPKPTHPQIAIDGRGRVVIAWDELVGGRRTAALVEANPRAAAVTFGAVVQIGRNAVAQYPVLAPTPDGLVAVWTRGVDRDQTIAVERVTLPAK